MRARRACPVGISIPHGTIKTGGGVAAPYRITQFQFHMVRLRPQSTAGISKNYLFQFHMVRLRQNLFHANLWECTVFQFHMVRLRRCKRIVWVMC